MRQRSSRVVEATRKIPPRLVGPELLLNRCGHRAILSLVKLISLVRKCWMVFSMHLLVPSCCRVVDRQSTSFCLLLLVYLSFLSFLLLLLLFFPFTFSPTSEFFFFFDFLPDDCFATFFGTNTLQISYNTVHVRHRWVCIGKQSLIDLFE